jgi:hypothetical protein
VAEALLFVEYGFLHESGGQTLWWWRAKDLAPGLNAGFAIQQGTVWF